MARYVIDLADKKDEPDLRRILRENYMDGSIELTFQREPDFFRSIEIDGEKVQIVVGRDLKKDKVIGFGIRAIRKLYINGKLENIGYLGNLRLDSEYRNGLMLARGYRYFKQLHKDKKAMIYLTSIVEDNKIAINVLTSGKAGFPPYNDFGTYLSYTIGLKYRKKLRNSDISILRFENRKIDDIVKFIHNEGKKKQFFPFYTKEDIQGKTKKLLGLKTENIFVAYRNGNIVGTMCIWDQSKIKQTVVHGYNKTMNIIRYPLDILSNVIDLPQLPSIGKPLNYFYGTLITIENNDLKIFRQLIEKVRMEGKKQGYDYMIIGLHSKDSLNKAMSNYLSYKLKTRIFIVHWDDGLEFYKSLDSRIPYIEVGTL